MNTVLQKIEEYHVNGTKILNLSHMNLHELPNLPDDIIQLDVSYNYITKLPKLPSNLSHLNCSYNSITKLPKLPSSLKSLNCSNNRLFSIKVPKSLSYLNISNNYFESKPQVNKNIRLIDTNNFYKSNNKKSFCYDIDLEEDVPLEHYLISSKDNIVIRINSKYLCHNRKVLEKLFLIQNGSYTIDQPEFKNLVLNQKEVNYLKNRKYSIYDFTKEGLNCYTTDDLMYL
jgi:Leucine-rich repeat (LRR) protein